MSEKRKFTMIVQEEPEGGYTGKCLELRGAISYGRTMDELKKNMKEAIELVLETLNEETQSKRKEIIEVIES
ncbi:MAG: type II toxin-antitoxin system HicB family antitoxin [Thaumarchaeota archaeon]|nr:type II toxin-antitoxin system HicB family antitoxin [Nitrososphaerota archaeon]MDE1877916.1 type II toxin-antitoxin system HicB family antitoxin [Nitrososphaerota archaeon]